MGIIGLLIAFLAPAWALMEGTPRPKAFERDFVITAYYSPVADQCCYVRGSMRADKALNGEGVRGADGTGVYPGMIAAPPNYAFGTRIVLPGLGAMTVHDRGGAIDAGDHADRLDIWVGYGEEGLARALAFGVRHVRGTVYPIGTSAPRERFALGTLASPAERLKPFLVLDHGLLDARPALHQKGLSVMLLQNALRDIGYFDHATTGLFEAATQKGLAAFQRDMKLTGTADRLTERSAAFLAAAVNEKHSPTSIPIVGPGSNSSSIATAQRLLRFLGVYRGRTDGEYDAALQKAILQFQQRQGLVGDATSPGAGRIGPLTRQKLFSAWRRALIAQRAGNLLLLRRVAEVLARSGRFPDTFLASGMTGPAVRSYQAVLAARGLFPADKINGVFGPLTAQVTVDYQKAAGIIRTAADENAGRVGPQTLRQLRRDEQEKMYKLVRGFGWGVL